MSFPERLKDLRTGKNISREMLAEYVGMSWHLIAKWETGKRDPDTEMVIKLAEYFGVTTDYLLGKVDNPKAQVINVNVDTARITTVESDWPEVANVLLREGKIPTPEKRKQIARIIRATLAEEEEEGK